MLRICSVNYFNLLLLHIPCRHSQCSIERETSKGEGVGEGGYRGGGAVRRGLIAGCGEHRPIMMMMMMIYDDDDDDDEEEELTSMKI